MRGFGDFWNSDRLPAFKWCKKFPYFYHTKIDTRRYHVFHHVTLAETLTAREKIGTVQPNITAIMLKIEKRLDTHLSCIRRFSNIRGEVEIGKLLESEFSLNHLQPFYPTYWSMRLLFIFLNDLSKSLLSMDNTPTDRLPN